MTEIGRFLVLVGLALVLIGTAVWVLGRVGFHGLPGDIRVETKNVRFYFPLATSVVLSLLLTALLWLWQWLSRK